MVRSRVLGIFGVIALSAVACAAPTDEESGESDAASSVDAYWADFKALKLDDLTRASVGYATNGLNDALTGGARGVSGGARFDAPVVFAAAAQTNRILPDNAKVKALDTLVSGLASQFGENELTTQVNKLRLAQVGRGGYFIESGFKVDASVAHGWSKAAEGIEESAISLGFASNTELSSRVIMAAPDDKLDDLVRSPLKALKDMRGFVYPRSVTDLKSMKPGEMFALQGKGQLGANFGVGAPILIAEPTAGLTYRVMVSAGISAVVSGQLDVQLVRLEGDEVVVDVGVQNGTARSFHAQLNDAWGVKGLCGGESCLKKAKIAGFDLNKIVERAIEKQLNDYLSFKVQGGASSASTRLSLSRFKFHLDKAEADKEVGGALEQLLKFDMRLAQGKAMKTIGDADAPVVQELDAVRQSTTTTRYFGFEVFGMNVFSKDRRETEGTFVMQTPDGASSILFKRVHEGKQWFQMPHDSAVTSVAAQTVDARNPDAFRSEANLYVQVAAGDTRMDDDILSDHIDAMIVGLGGKDIVDVLDKHGNRMEQYVWQKCPVQEDENNRTKPWDEACNVALLDPAKDAFLTEEKTAALRAIEPMVARLPGKYADLVRQAANTRLILQSVGIHNLDVMNGPNVSFTLDTRFDDNALDMLTRRGSKDRYRSALLAYLTQIQADRRDGTMTKDGVRAAIEANREKMAVVDAMTGEFDRRAQDYQLLALTEKAVAQKLPAKGFLGTPIGIRFQIDRNDANGLRDVVVKSVARERAAAAEALFGGLKERAKKMSGDLFEEQHAAFPLLAMVPKENLEVGMQIRADVRSTFWVKQERYLKAGLKPAAVTAKGENVSKIAGGMFDITKVVEP
jgi:hypothetical protein